jgi:hypothetical protein
MADYINIRGQNIEVVASDPANPTQGQIWYNSTSNTLKGASLSTAGTWATSGALNNLRTQTNLMIAGTQTAAIVTSLTGSPSTSTTELYNGSAWTNSPATFPTNWFSNRRIHRSRSTINSYNHSFLTLYLSI